MLQGVQQKLHPTSPAAMSVKRVNLHKRHQSPIGFGIHALQANHIQADSPETRQADSHVSDHKERAMPVSICVC